MARDETNLETFMMLEQWEKNGNMMMDKEKNNRPRDREIKDNGERKMPFVLKKVSGVKLIVIWWAGQLMSIRLDCGWDEISSRNKDERKSRTRSEFNKDP